MLGKDWRDGEHQRWLAAHEDTAARAAVEGAWTPEMIELNKMVCRVLGDDVRIILDSPLDSLPTDGIIYLGSPYSRQANLDYAASRAAEAAGSIMMRGFVVYSPICHGHFIAAGEDFPQDWSFWKRQCDPFIEVASALVVLKLDGWRDSVGLTYEIARFHEAGKPIVYVTMEDLANG